MTGTDYAVDTEVCQIREINSNVLVHQMRRRFHEQRWKYVIPFSCWIVLNVHGKGIVLWSIELYDVLSCCIETDFTAVCLSLQKDHLLNYLFVWKCFFFYIFKSHLTLLYMHTLMENTCFHSSGDASTQLAHGQRRSTSQPIAKQLRETREATPIDRAHPVKHRPGWDSQETRWCLCIYSFSNGSCSDGVIFSVFMTEMAKYVKRLTIMKYIMVNSATNTLDV